MFRAFLCFLCLSFLLGCGELLDSDNNRFKKHNCSYDKDKIDWGDLGHYEEQVRKYESNDQKSFSTPTRRAATHEIPNFIDDIDFEWFELGINRQLKRFEQKRKGKGLEGTIRFGQKEYPLERIVESLEVMKAFVLNFKHCLYTARSSSQHCYNNLNQNITKNFDVYIPHLVPGDPRYGEQKPALFTAYYTPLIKGSVDKSTKTPFPIYKRPASEKDRKKTRGEIDFNNELKGKSLELFYGPDLFQLYLLHVEGGGKVEYLDKNNNKKSTYLSYDGTNSQRWNFISKYMKKKGYINNGSIAAQRKFLEENPDKWEEIYSTCPSYVYFKTTKTPPLGNDQVPLTDRRSIALDSKLYNFKGVLAFVKSRRPVENWDDSSSDFCKNVPYRPFSRFYIDQDTGGAIKGKARGDLYMGESRYAKFAAALMKERGDIYFLVLKDAP